MTSFGWKRKAGAGVIRKASQAFEEEAKDEELDNEVTRGEVDWLTLAPKNKKRYWEAITKWDEAILLSPTNSQMLEMKSQALMAVGEVFPAVQAAQQAVKADPTWWVARQTLGRAQLNMGEVGLAVRSFSKAVMLNPGDKDLWQEDLLWACSVRDRSKTVMKCNPGGTSKPPSSSVTVSASESDPTTSDCEEKHAVIQRINSSLDSDLADGRRGDSEETDCEQMVLKVPPNYVHLRG